MTESSAAHHRAGEHTAKRGKVVWITALVVLIATAGFSQSRREFTYRLQAVYLLNFVAFTEWPDSVFEDERSPIIIGVVGKDPFGSVLDEVVSSETVGERQIKIIRFKTMDEITPCHVLYFCLSERGNYSSHLERLKKQPTLTVSEIDGFGYLGGCISFYLERNKLRFEINMEALEESGVDLSSKLLRFARIINPMRGS